MKKSELQKIIKEELKSILSEDTKSDYLKVRDALQPKGFSVNLPGGGSANASIHAPSTSPKMYRAITDTLDQLKIKKYRLDRAQKPGYYILTLESSFKKSELQKLIKEEVYNILHANLNENIDSKLDKIIKIVMNKYNRNIKIRDLRKIGLSDKEIQNIENDYKVAYIAATNKLHKKIYDVPENFGKISVGLNDYNDIFLTNLKRQLYYKIGNNDT